MHLYGSNCSLHRLLETKYGVTLMEADQEIEAGLASNKDAQLLKVVPSHVHSSRNYLCASMLSSRINIFGKSRQVYQLKWYTWHVVYTTIPKNNHFIFLRSCQVYARWGCSSLFAGRTGLFDLHTGLFAPLTAPLQLRKKSRKDTPLPLPVEESMPIKLVEVKWKCSRESKKEQ